MPDAVRIFVGVDPGTKGAAAVLACIDCPGDDARHGQVVGYDVFDLPTTERTGLDGGGLDLDVAAFVSRLTTAVNVAADLSKHVVAGQSALVEFPDVGGKMLGGRRQVLVQGLNAGMVFAAVRSGLSITTGWVASRSWRAEVEGNDASLDYHAALAVLGLTPPASDDPNRNPLLAPVSRTHATVRPDRCVAVLLAEVARRRWLGTAVVPKTKGAAAAAKARKSNRRREAVARAVAPLTVAKAKLRAVAETLCSQHMSSTTVASFDGAANVPCLPRCKCCEARLLDWAWRQRPDLPGPPVKAMKIYAALLDLGDVVSIYRKTTSSKLWTVARSDTDELSTMEPEHFDLLEMHGLVQLQAVTRDVRYAPTERGLTWSLRLIKDELRAACASAPAPLVAEGLPQ